MNNLEVEIDPQTYSLTAISHQKKFLSYDLRNLKVFPFVQLTFSPVYSSKQHLKAAPVQIRTQQVTKLKLITPLVFGHRGNWEIIKVQVKVRDLLGLFSFTKNFPVRKTITVEPKPEKYRERKLIVSTYSSGEQLNLPAEPQGDYYDLKRYNPADGINKLVWKIYARTGELVSRKQEQAAEPNGQILVYALARQLGDSVASESLNYLLQLKNYQADFKFSCFCCSIKRKQAC